YRPRASAEVDAVSGCVMLIAREVLERVGLLDEAYFFSFEDVDFCRRARGAGFTSLCVGDAVALHDGSRSIGRRAAARLYFGTRNQLRVAERTAPAGPVHRRVRAAVIVALNLLHALVTAEAPRPAGVGAVRSLNSDVGLEPEFVAALVEALERRPEAGWAAGAMRQLRPQGVVDAIDCYGHWLLPSRYVYGCDPARRRPDEYPAECLVFGASACAALYRRRMLEDLALDGEIFDEDLFAYFEDVDLDWRAQQRGWRCVFTPA